MRRWGWPLAAVLMVIAASTVALTRSERSVVGDEQGAPGLVARLVDETGEPLRDAEVRVGDQTVSTDDSGILRTELSGGPQLLTIAADDHLPRTQAVTPGTPVEFRLTARAEATLSLRFGGDVMFGRRFYDPDEDGDRSDGLLREGATAGDHAALLSEVRPLLEDGDLTVVNLETALVEQPWTATGTPRPPLFNPTKDLILASAPAAAQALVDTGVDVVSLANNHVYDALGAGLDSTLASLDRAGLVHFGAGRTVDEAWAPAVVERKGQRVAFLGCTTVSGSDEAIANVAGEDQGGAARCTTDRLGAAVLSARAGADMVVVMIHGGAEYETRQSERVQELTAIASAAGAALVVNGHPHVVGGVASAGAGLVAESLGNLLFDQTVWPTFLSYVLRVDTRAGQPVLTTVDPVFLEDYVPRPTTGPLADAAARRAAGLIPGGGAALRAPGAVFTAGTAPEAEEVEYAADVDAVVRLAAGWWPQDAAARVGEDLLWSGSFEDLDTDPETEGAHGWVLGPGGELTSAAACSGEVGVRLARSPASTEDVLAAPGHRQLVAPGTDVTVVVDVRDASAGATLELRWYDSRTGGSTSGTSVTIPEGADGDTCRQIRLDATVPDGIVAVQPAVRLPPTDDAQFSAQVSFDDMMLVSWADRGESGRRYSVLDGRGRPTVTLARDPGAGDDPVAFPAAR